jgi:hypothetical protein
MDKPDLEQRLTPVKFHSYKKFPSGGKKPIWEFLCKCGKKTTAILSAVQGGHTRSCGCLGLEFKQKHRESNAVFILKARNL